MEPMEGGARTGGDPGRAEETEEDYSLGDEQIQTHTLGQIWQAKVLGLLGFGWLSMHVESAVQV